MKPLMKEYVKICLFLLMFPITYLVFYIVLLTTDARLGYWIGNSIYWLIITAFSIYYFGPGNIARRYRTDKSKANWWSLAAFIPVVATFFIAFIPSFPKLTVSLMILTIFSGIINGTCEELFWRGLTLQTAFKRKHIVIVFSLLGFGMWHLTLATVPGISYQGGVPALVGGAVFMGIIWQFVVLKTNNILHVTVAHVLTNIFAFSTLILENW